MFKLLTPLFLALTFFANVAFAEITFDSAFSDEQQKVILSAIKEAQNISSSLRQPEKVHIALSPEKRFVAAATDPAKDTIHISSSLLRLTKESLRAMVAHEYTHFVVALAFKNPGQEKSIYDEVKAAQEDYDRIALMQAHLPYAELLSDLMAIMIVRDPKALAEAMFETQDDMKLIPELAAYAYRLFIDRPLELAVRDFSVPLQDPRWGSFRPQDLVYNRFNQVRSYFWQKHIRGMPLKDKPAFFAKTVQVLAQVFNKGDFEANALQMNVVQSNAKLMAFLDQNLK